MIRTTIFFAWRYLKGTNRTRTISTLVKICFGAIMLGTFCLTLVAAIMHGFEQATYTTLQSIHADIIIEAPSTEDLNANTILQVLKKEFPNIIASAPRASSYVILETTHNDYIHQNIVTLQALDPQAEAQTTQLEQTLCAPQHTSLVQLIHSHTIVIGSKLAHDIGVGIGDTITLYYAPDQQHTTRNITFQTHTVTVAGIFSTGIAEYDASVIWGSFELFNTLFPNEGITSLGLRLAPRANHKQTLQDLRLRFGLTISPWYSLYPALLQALQLEQYAMFIILFLIVILAALTMVSTLLLHIEHKRTDIALLRAMGMTIGEVTHIFMFLGFSIAGTATVCGMLSGWFASWIINTYKLISLPEAYYISYLPAHVSPSYFFILFGIVCVINLLVVWHAARTSRALSISTILRGETC